MKTIVGCTLLLMSACLYFAITDPRDRPLGLGLAAAQGVGLLWYCCGRR
jgi:hypothetical protein